MRIKGVICHIFFAIFEKSSLFLCFLLKAITGNYKLRAGCRGKDGQKEYYILYNI